IDADLGQEAIRPAVVAVLERLEVAPHATGAPGRIAGEAGDVVPVRVVRIDHDHGVVGGAAAQGARARIENPVDPGAVPRLAVFRILSLARLAAVVADRGGPRPRAGLAGAGVGAGHVVVV